MAQEPQAPQTQEEEQMGIFETMEEYNVELPVSVERIYSKLPKVFVDGYSLVKVSLTKRFENCSQYISRSGASFSGCMMYDDNYGGSFKDVRGIYYVPITPLVSIRTRKKFTGNLNEMKEIIEEFTQTKVVQNRLEIQKKLLIVYDNNNDYTIKVYDKFVKGKILKFPLRGQQGHLWVSQVPKIDIMLPFERISYIEIYNHKINFEKEVIGFYTYSFGGWAGLIYNQNDAGIEVKLQSEDHEEVTVFFEPHKLYLFTHPKPRRNTVD